MKFIKQCVGWETVLVPLDDGHVPNSTQKAFQPFEDASVSASVNATVFSHDSFCGN